MADTPEPWAGPPPGERHVHSKKGPGKEHSMRKSYFVDLSIRRVRALARRDACTFARERRNVGEEPKRNERRPHTRVQR